MRVDYLDNLPYQEKFVQPVNTITGRFPEPVLKEACDPGVLSGYVCSTTITTIHYLASKTIGTTRSREEIKRLLSLVNVTGVNRSVLESALSSRIPDFEDAVIVSSGIQSGVEAITTRNIKDFKYSEIPVYTPEEILKILQVKSNE